LTLLGIEPQPLGCAAHSLVTVQIELSRLTLTEEFQNKLHNNWSFIWICACMHTREQNLFYVLGFNSDFVMFLSLWRGVLALQPANLRINQTWKHRRYIIQTQNNLFL
jgi:hypothetical protein